MHIDRLRHYAPLIILPLVISGASLVFQFLGTDSTLLLRYQRHAIMNGEWWRLLSGNFIHLGWNHLLMNVAGFILIWLIIGRLLSQWQWLIVIFISSIAVGTGLLAFNPHLEWYVGLSGMLHGLFVAGLVINIKHGYKLEWLLLAGLTAKLLWEQVYGGLPGTATLAGGAVIVDAHLYGAIGGLLISLIIQPSKKTGQHK